MILPIGTDRPLRRPTLINHGLIAVNVAAFVAISALARFSPSEAERVHMHMVLGGELGLGWGGWRFLSYQFGHADWWHLIGNMMVLWVFGPNVEDRLTRAGYLAFYLVGGVIAGGLHVLFDDHPVIGASGSIAAVTGAYLVLFPRTLIRCFVFFFYIGVYMLPAWAFIAFAIAKDIFYAGAGGGGVAYLAHIGGYMYGASVCMILLATRALKREPYDLFTMGKQAYRRRQFQELGVKRDEAVARKWEQAKRSETVEKLAAARAEVSTLMAKGDVAGAAAAYRRLADSYADQPGAVTLSIRHQHDIANHYFVSADYPAAAFAFERFLAAYPKESNAAEVRLMLAVISAKYLNDPVRAKQLLAGLEAELPEGENRVLAKQLVEDLA